MVSAFYFPEEITDKMIEEWIEEAKDYRDENVLQLDSTDHLVSRTISDPNYICVVAFYTPARLTITKAHEAQRLYKNLTAQEVRSSILDHDSVSLIVRQMIFTSTSINENARNTINPDRMHLVFVLREFDKLGKQIKEEFIQPIKIDSQDSSLSQGIGQKLYAFSFEDFPSMKEYEEGNYEMVVKFISAEGEQEINIPREKIR